MEPGLTGPVQPGFDADTHSNPHAYGYQKRNRWRRLLEAVSKVHAKNRGQGRGGEEDGGQGVQTMSCNGHGVPALGHLLSFLAT